MARLNSLPLFHQIAGARVVVVGEGPMAEAKQRLVERAGGVVCSEAEAHHARLAFVALEDERAARATAQRLRGKGLLVNVADRPELCDFTTPSILDRNPVLIAVGTGGASAGLAKHLRLRLEGLLPEGLGSLANALQGTREKLRARFPDAADRRRALDDALREGGALDPLNPAAADHVEGWSDGTAGAPAAQQEEIILTSADPEDLTLRQARWLGEADLLLLDGDIPPTILARARADAERLPYSASEAEKSRDGLILTLRYHP